MLLWQPSDCIGLFVIDYIFVLFSENKYNDDDDDVGLLSCVGKPKGSIIMSQK